MKDESQRTYLHLAFAWKVDADMKGSKQLAMVRALLDHGASTTINAIDRKKETPLLPAVTQGASETVKLLVENAADINKQVESRMHPLLYAAKRESFAIVHILLEAGADVKVINPLGKSALWEAVSNNNITMAKLLLEEGADPNWKSHFGKSLIFHALHTVTLRLLSNSNQLDVFGVFDLLLTSGANPNSIDHYGQTILIAAIRAGVYSIIETLLGHGADANLRDKAGITPLSFQL
ncbi:ankyrin repeat PH and SEC7 domain containing protein secG [Penicillium malachiteum]|uniref:Ankyrin repeat PH and SEC7 domain containing protein secG n=1 Tax=Penicillium malachiteum TaxID=1324776 RepID=A0AAD6HAE4_9EURO|nr:ankyrin repeat PH and SEC7 domain containing protein secG [Penicillium malachiteum]